MITHVGYCFDLRTINSDQNDIIGTGKSNKSLAIYILFVGRLVFGRPMFREAYHHHQILCCSASLAFILSPLCFVYSMCVIWVFLFRRVCVGKYRLLHSSRIFCHDHYACLSKVYSVQIIWQMETKLLLSLSRLQLIRIRKYEQKFENIISTNSWNIKTVYLIDWESSNS